MVKAALADPEWQSHSRRGERLGVAVATPIYYPFLSAPENHVGAELFTFPLARRPLNDGTPNSENIWRYEIDEEALRATLQRDNVRVLLWCNPHNPTGRVWTREEMRIVAQACVDHDVALLSDEVWADLILDEEATPFTGAAAILGEEEIGERLAETGLVILTSPSKTYNVAALDLAMAVIPNKDFRHRFTKVGADVAEVPPFGYAAALACYDDPSGEVESWRQRLVHYLKANRDQVQSRVEHQILLCTFPVPYFCFFW